MIIDKISEAHKYYNVHPFFREAFETLGKIDNNVPDEKIIIDSDKAFINPATYTNKNVSECKFENHRKYIDIQFIIDGHEYIDVTDADDTKITEDNMEKGDIAFYKAPDTFTRADLTKGYFAVLFPGEAHRPGVAPDGKGIKTRKAVAKILY